jgi:dihydroflavonol-4-reductase
MKVLVTGGTGFVGSWVVRELVARGHAVRVLLRRTSNRVNLEGLPIEIAEGDVLDPDSVGRALAGCEGVVHTAGIAHFRPGHEKEMYEVNEGGVKVVLGAALTAGVRRAVLTSSTAAMGGARTPRVADESTPSNAEALGIDYFVSKLRGEQAALELAGRGLPVCALRPVVMFGPGDIYQSSATTVLALARRKLPVYVQGGASFCDVRDVARAHAEALERGKTGEVYILGGHNFEISKLVGLVAKMAGVRPPVRAPFALAYPIAAVVEVSTRAMRREPDLSRQLLRASRLYTYVSSAKACQQLRYNIRPFEETLRDTLRFFLRAGRLKPHTPELAALAQAPA